MKICVIIPALNEEKSIGRAISAIRESLQNLSLDHEIFVCDNGSSDNTSTISRSNGAQVINAPVRGYGSACLAGIAALPADCDIVLFMDADLSDDARDASGLLNPLIYNRADLVIGSRPLLAVPGSLTFVQKFGNWLSTYLIYRIWKYRYSDLGPFRAIRYSALLALKMNDLNYGWTIQMQIRAIKQKLRILEINVHYRRRVGVSKISGTIRGSVMAGMIILRTIWQELRVNK